MLAAYAVCHAPHAPNRERSTHLSGMSLPCPAAQVVEASSDDGSSFTTTPYINDLGEAQRWDGPPAEMLGYAGRWVVPVPRWERVGCAAGLGW